MTDLRELLTALENGPMANKVANLNKTLVRGSEQIYGMLAAYMSKDSPGRFLVVGGNNVWGTELLLTSGTTIESGDASKVFSLDSLYVLSNSVANKVNIIEFLYGTAGPAIAAISAVVATSIFTKVGSGLANGDKVILTNATGITGVSATEVYYIINMAGNTFQFSKTLAGAAVVLGGVDGTAQVNKLTQTSLCKTVVSTGLVADSTPTNLSASKIPCDQYLFVRAKSETGQTVSIEFLMGLHTY